MSGYGLSAKFSKKTAMLLLGGITACSQVFDMSNYF